MKKQKAFIVIWVILFLTCIIGIKFIMAEWSCYGTCSGCTLLNCDHDEISECCACCPHSQLGRVCCCFPDQGCHLAN